MEDRLCGLLSNLRQAAPASVAASCLATIATNAIADEIDLDRVSVSRPMALKVVEEGRPVQAVRVPGSIELERRLRDRRLPASGSRRQAVRRATRPHRDVSNASVGSAAARRLSVRRTRPPHTSEDPSRLRAELLRPDTPS